MGITNTLKNRGGVVWRGAATEAKLESSKSLGNTVSKTNNDVTVVLILFSEFVGLDRPRQLALNGSTTEYKLKNVAHDTEYVLTLYVLFGSVVGPGISATFRTCEYLGSCPTVSAMKFKSDHSSLCNRIYFPQQTFLMQCNLVCYSRKVTGVINYIKSQQNPHQRE